MTKPFPWEDNQKGYDEWLEDLFKNCPESWGAGEGSAESIIADYLHQLELRVDELGGSLEKYPEVSEVEITLCYGLIVPHKAGLHPDQCNGCKMWIQIMRLSKGDKEVKMMTCTTCGGAKRIKDKNGNEGPCPTCHGTGQIPDPNAPRPEDFN